MGISPVFINRTQELKFLRNDVKINIDKSRFLLVSAKSGIGKSELIDKVFSENTVLKFRVKIPQSSEMMVSEGFFFKELTKLFHNNSIEFDQYASLTEYIDKNTFYKGIALGVKNTLFKYIGIKTFNDGYKEARKKNNDIKKWISGDEELLSICFSYLLYVLKTNKVFIAFDNFQKVDDLSLALLKDLMVSTTNGYFVGEYTIKQDHFEVEDQLSRLRDENIRLNLLKISKIPKKELIDAVLNEKDLIIGILQDSYDKSEGNLHKFKLLRQTFAHNDLNIQLNDIDSVTSSILNRMDHLSILLLTYVDIHAGRVEKKNFYTFLRFICHDNKFESDKHLQILNDLHRINLINIGANHISINHDSISEDLSKIHHYRKVISIASREWLRFYAFMEKQPINSELDYIDNLLWQVHFLIKIKSFDEIVNILEKVSQCIAEEPSNNVINYLDKIAEIYRSNYNKDIATLSVVKWLVVTYYQCGYHKRIVDFINSDELEDPTILLCYLASGSTNHTMHELVLRKINIIKHKVSDNVLLALKLIEIRTLRSCYNLDLAKKKWLRYYKKGTFLNTSFEAHFLKYVSLVIHDDFTFRVDCLEKALKLYEQNNDKYGMISSYSTISRDCAYLNQIERAEYYINKSDEISYNSIYPKYQIYNNQSVIDLIKRKVNPRTKERLANALKICTNSGNQLIISSNLLCVYILEKDKFSGFRLYNNLKKKIFDSFNTESLIDQVCLYNCFKYAILIGDDLEAKKILNDYLKKMNFYRFKNLWNYLIFNEGNNPFPYMIKNDFYPHFIVDWEVDYYSALNSYQPATLN
jgi:hypothetical protein